MKLAKCGPIPVFVFAVLIVSVLAFNVAQVYVLTMPNLLFVLNVMFITGTSIAVAFISAKSYLDHGAMNILVFGIAILTIGLGAALAGWASAFSANANVTIYNIGILLFSSAQLLGAILTATGIGASLPKHRKASFAAAYILTVVTMFSISYLAIMGFLPVFFTNTGATVLREAVLGVALFFLFLTLLVLGVVNLRLKSRTLFWYFLALVTIAMGLLGSLFIKEFGGVLAWLTRSAQYLGNFYFLIALLRLNIGMEPTSELAEKWTEAFRQDKTIDALFANMNEGLSYNKILLDGNGKPVDFITLEINDTFKRVTGVGKEILGQRATEFYGSSEKDFGVRITSYGKVAATGEPAKFEYYSDRFQRWLAESVYSVEKGYFAIILRDIGKRKKAEDEVRSVALFPSQNPYPVLRIGKDGTVLYSNSPGSFSLSEWSSSLGQPVPQHWRKIVLEVLDSGRIQEIDETYQGKTFSYAFVPISEWGYVNVYGRDLTERKKLEAQLKDTAEKYSILFDTTSDGVWIHNLMGEILEVNDAYCRMSGYTREELTGMPISKIEAVYKPSEITAHIKRMVEGGGHESFESKHRRKDGSVFDVDIAELYLEREGGRIAIFVRDITKRKKDEETLRETRNYLENLLNYANAPIIVWDTNFKITLFNHAFEHLTGFTAGDAVGNDLTILFPEDKKDEAMKHIRDALAGEYWESVEIPILHVNGTVKTALWNSANIYDKSGEKIVATIAQGQDITERKKTEEALKKSEEIARYRAQKLEKMQSQLEEKATQLEEFATSMEALAEERALKLKDAERLATIGATAGMVGHDIRNPLQSIVGDLYLVKNDLASMPQSPEKTSIVESLNAVEKSVDYINKIVADLQDFAKPLNPVFEQIDLRGLVTQVLAEHTIPDNVQAYSRVKSDARKMTADSGYLKRILDNLVSNAVQAMPKGGKLSIEASTDGDYVAITVEDNGVGIPEQFRTKLFTPLFTTKSKGQGFGLAVCKRLVEAQTGTISFESKEGKGTKFIVRIPQKQHNKRTQTGNAKN